MFLDIVVKPIMELLVDSIHPFDGSIKGYLGNFIVEGSSWKEGVNLDGIDNLATIGFS